jgi:hypothetical protein
VNRTTTQSAGSAGTYDVLFDQNIVGCAYLGTIGLPGIGGVSAPGFLTVAGLSISPYGVFVETSNATGVPSNFAFHLGVFC